MTRRKSKRICYPKHMSPRAISVLLAVLLVLVAVPAHAFRCGNKLVREDMHEQQVLVACGEPATIRYLGTAVRNVHVPTRRRLLPGISSERYVRYGGYNYYTQEVVITEYVYNFGPRKFMRRLLFEGGVLVSIEKIGYGYID